MGPGVTQFRSWGFFAFPEHAYSECEAYNDIHTHMGSSVRGREVLGFLLITPNQTTGTTSKSKCAAQGDKPGLPIDGIGIAGG